MIKRQKRAFSVISCDITNHCNARCLWCFNEWGKPCTMASDVHEKIYEILPYTPTGSFLWSCLYEPTLHPQFDEFIANIPEDGKNKCVFTTNLSSRKLEQSFDKLSRANLLYFNISLETFDKEKYTKLTSIKNSNFYENLDKLHSTFSKNENSVPYNFITMMLKDNYTELPDIAKRASTSYSPKTHHFRTPYYFSSAKDRNLADLLLSASEIEHAVQAIKDAGCTNMLFQKGLDKETFEQIVDTEDNYLKLAKINNINVDFEVNYEVRINADGTVYIPGLNYCEHLNTIGTHSSLYERSLLSLQEQEANRYKFSACADLNVSYSQDSSLIKVEDITIYDERFILLKGRINFKSDSLYITCVDPEEKYHFYKLNSESTNTGFFKSFVDGRTAKRKHGNTITLYQGLLTGHDINLIELCNISLQ